jgi:predicted glycosyltransferase
MEPDPPVTHPRRRDASRFLFYSHDGFGLGHVRRNILIARALLARDPSASITVITGVPVRPPWLEMSGCHVVRVPALIKDGRGQYRPLGVTFEEAVSRRGEVFSQTVSEFSPDVIVVDRHPYGTAGELREGLESARRRGAYLVLGLRDVLDEPDVIVRELLGGGWEGVEELFSEILVYGARQFYDHEAQYGLPVRPRYCGWVTDRAPSAPRQPFLLGIAAGGGGDGGPVFRLGVDLLERLPSWTAELVAGPYADTAAIGTLAVRTAVGGRLKMATEVDGCGPLFRRAEAVLQMAGYNSTFEALAAGQRSILVPRRSPRREQEIRAHRLADLGLADVVDEEAQAADVEHLLDGPRHLTAKDARRAGIILDGANRVASRLRSRAIARRRR